MINREKILQTAGSVLKHAMCSKREGSEALYGRNQLGVGLYSVGVHAAQPAGQPRARTTVSTLERTPFLSVSFGGRNWYTQGASAEPRGVG